MQEERITHRTFTRRAFLSAMGASLLLGGFTSSARSQPLPTVAFGAHMGHAPGQTPAALAPWDLYYYEKREAQLGRRLDFCMVMESWRGEDRYRPFKPEEWSPLTTQRYPVMIWTWSPEDWTYDRRAAQNEALAPPAIATGEHDAYIDAYADQVTAWGHRVIIRMMHEMNGDWMQWSPGFFPGQSASDFVAAWQHIVDRFRARGATNVEWCWCPNVFGPAGEYMGGENARANIESLYPGDEYVDWVGIDAYNNVPEAPTRSLKRLLTGGGNLYQVVRTIAPDKPVMLPEFGCNKQADGGKPWFWIGIETNLRWYFPEIRAISCWDRNLDGKFAVDSSAISLLCYKLLAKDPYFQRSLQNIAVR